MSQEVSAPTKSFPASGALGQYLRVKTPSSLALAGATDFELGTLVDATFSSSDYGTVRLASAEGTVKMVASEAISAAADVYAAASGKIASTGYVFIGRALEAASGDGSVIEVLRMPKQSHSPIVDASASGALTVKQSTVVITKAGVAALTLAAPSTAQNGLVLRVISTTANAHTITATGLIDDGVTGGSKTTATFAAYAGASIELVAYGGKWNVQSKNAVTIS